MRVEQIGLATLYLGDCLQVELPRDAAIVSDPPYGMGWNTDSRQFTGGDSRRGPGRNWPRIEGDDQPFQPQPWLEFPECILFGYQHFAPRVPLGTILVWQKKSAANLGTFLSDAELAWQKSGHGVYVYESIDSALGRRAETQTPRAVHPTQKPEKLMRWCVQRTKAETVVDPFMGSGTTGVAAVSEGRRFVGVELVPEYFEVACRRIDAAQRQGSLF